MATSMEEQSMAGIMDRGGIRQRDYTRGRALSRRGSEGGGLLSRLGSTNGEKLARGLGWFSLGLGLAQVLVPERVQRLAGICGDYTGTMRLMGLRELGHAFLILVAGKPREGVLSRVVGDAIDLGGLGTAMNSRCHDRERLTLATAQVAGVAALDLLAAAQLSRGGSGPQRRRRQGQPARMHKSVPGGAFQVTKSVTINRSPEALYHYWHNFENLPNFMYHLESVEERDEGRSHWVAKAPAGMTVAWDAEITDDRPNEMIAWRSLPDADVPNSGSVRFEPGPAGRGTVVRVAIEYRPPAGAVGKLVATLFGEEPGQQVAGDLHRFKQVMETGEVVRSEGSPHGFGQKRQRPAQPKAGGNGERRTEQRSEQAQA